MNRNFKKRIAMSIVSAGAIGTLFVAGASAQRDKGDHRGGSDHRSSSSSSNSGSQRSGSQQRPVQQQVHQDHQVHNTQNTQVYRQQNNRVVQNQQNTQVYRQQEHRPIQNTTVFQQQNDRRITSGRVPEAGPYQRYDRGAQERLQQERLNAYNGQFRNWQNMQREREQWLQRDHRLRYYSYEQNYWNRLRGDQLRLQQARYYDNLAYNYRYFRGGQYFYTSQYGAQMLQNALNNGYEQGYFAGQADRQDGWRFDYQNSFGFQDGAYGYDSYYVPMSEYQYYFRQGFQRGYEDGYYGQSQYGEYEGGRYQILGSIIGSILDVATY